jgi:hypothetical protein
MRDKKRFNVEEYSIWTLNWIIRLEVKSKNLLSGVMLSRPYGWKFQYDGYRAVLTRLCEIVTPICILYKVCGRFIIIVRESGSHHNSGVR